MKTITTFLLALLATAALFAQPYPATSYELSEDKLTLTKWTGDEAIINMQDDPVLKNVKHIGNQAFYENKTLVSISFPDALESIGSLAFSECSRFMGALIIPNKVKSIGPSAFWGCSKLTGELTIPNSVKSIGFSAFNRCSGFTGALTIGNGVTSIGEEAFWGCSRFTGTLTIGDSVESIGSKAFSGCKGLTAIRILAKNPPEVKMTNAGLNTELPFTVPAGCLKIYSKTVYWRDFKKITEYSIPTGSYELSPDGLTLLRWIGAEKSVDLKIDPVLKKLKHIGENAFKNNSTLTFISFPDSLESIKKQAFFGCSQLAGELTILHSVTNIGEQAFSGCPFTAINMLATAAPTVQNNDAGLNTTLPFAVPSGCLEIYTTHPYWGRFKEITEPPIPTDRYELSADGATLLRWKGAETSINMQAEPVLKKVKHIAESAFAKPNEGTDSDSGKNYDENKTLKTIVLPEALETIGAHAFIHCTALTGDLAIPNSVTNVAKNAFRGCKGFKGSLKIGESVTSLGEGAFENCTGLSGELIIPNSVTEIGKFAFYKCSSFTGSLSFGENIETIRKQTFFQCTGLDGSLNIGKNMKYIGEKAFVDCPFAAINILGTTPPTVPKNNPGLNEASTLAVPKDCKDTYKNHSYWGKFTISDILSSIDKVEAAAKEFRFYPSPVENILTVDFEKSIEGYALYSGTAVLLQSKKTKDKQLKIDMRNYPSGIYFLRLLSQEKTKTIKLIKK